MESPVGIVIFPHRFNASIFISSIKERGDPLRQWNWNKFVPSSFFLMKVTSCVMSEIKRNDTKRNGFDCADGIRTEPKRLPLNWRLLGTQRERVALSVASIDSDTWSVIGYCPSDRLVWQRDTMAPSTLDKSCDAANARSTSDVETFFFFSFFLVTSSFIWSNDSNRKERERGKMLVVNDRLSYYLVESFLHRLVWRANGLMMERASMSAYFSRCQMIIVYRLSNRTDYKRRMWSGYGTGLPNNKTG